MKTEFVDVNETRKNVRVEIPSEVVDAEIDRHARDYSRKARIPGFRPGKAPARVIKQRFKEQILHDVAHDLIPPAVDEALRERGVEAVDTPDVRDVTVEEGQPLSFTASFDTVPAFEPGDYTTISLRRPSSRVEDEAVAQALQRLRDRAARYEPVEGRGVDAGDTAHAGPRSPGSGGHDRQPQGCQRRDWRGRQPARLRRTAARPRSRRDQDVLDPLSRRTTRLPSSRAPTSSTRWRSRRSSAATLPELDDEFAKDLGAFETLDALRARVREDLEHEARHAADREVRAQLMKQLAARVPFDVPASLLERELDRRIEEFAHRLVDQKIDPNTAGIDWRAFRESQRDPAREAVAAALVIEEVARREQLDATDEEVDQEVARYAERMGRAPAALRAELEKERGLSRLRSGLRREKAIDFLMARATISAVDS